MDHYIGKMLDNRYELLEQIGKGGMANVYKAKCHRLNRMVAVKILKSDLADSEDFRRRFQAESQAVAQLSHANIVSVYDVSRSDDVEYIVMELIEGITLKQYMERRGQMDWREALHFITQIMRGLSHAHSRGIIHRDIKPQNIMILRDGSVKVADFGIACLANDGQTLTQEALGSVHYISPEQARGDRMDVRSDIYSAGVVLYEMLTGRLPFEGDSAVSVAIQHLSSVPLAPRDINPDTPEALELICMKAMNPNISKRYRDADAMLEDLEKFRKNPDVNLDYIRVDLQEKEDTDPTQPISVAEVNSATRNARQKLVSSAEEAEKERKKKLMMIIGGAVVGVLLLLLLIFKIAGSLGEPEEPVSYVVPDLLGKTVEEAEALPEIKDIFTIEVFGSKLDDNYEPGQIIEQEPAAGLVRKNNLIITVYVCAEEETEAMPSVVGSDFQYAKVQLANLNMGLGFEVQEKYSDKYEAGQVISTTPAAGEPLKKGYTVLLVVSKGKEATVSKFVGMHIDEAAAKAEGLGLSVTTPYQEEYSDKEKGTVLTQSVPADTKVTAGMKISFTVSSGPEPKDPEPVAPEMVSKTIAFTIPPEYTGTQELTFKLNDESVATVTLENAETAGTITHTFTGEKGTTTIVSLCIGETEINSQEITF